MLEYGFDHDHFIILDWFLYFKHCDKMKKIIGSDGDTYYWIKYGKLLHDFPCFRSKRKIKRLLDELCGLSQKRIPGLVYPMVRHIEKVKTTDEDKEDKGTFVCFKTIDEIISYLKSENENTIRIEEKEPDMITAQSLVSPSMIANHHTTTAKKKVTHIPIDIKPKTRKIIEELLVEGSPFSHRLNNIGEPASKTLLCIEKKLLSLYAGTFLKDYGLDKCWQRGKDLSVFDEMKGDWHTISNYLFEAANKYKKWEERKIKSIDTWLYNPRTCKSTFLTAISMSKPDQDFAAEKVLDTIAKNDPKSASAIAELLDKRNGWGNAFVCVESLKSVLQYLYQNWYTLQSNNKELWHYRKPAEILSNYGVFLSMQKTPDPKYMNINGYLWKKFIDNFYGETEIDLEITA